MYPDQLKSLLPDGQITLGSIPALAEVCKNWFTANPTIATYILRSIFKGLAETWDDSQGVLKPEYVPFEQQLFPLLAKIISLMAASPGAQPIDELSKLVVTYRDCCLKANQAAEHFPL